ncbi:protein argonaute-2-like [Centruroides vittatus]|uniref:protein argonaute-2-like n=1 Tax=Centruroides vittatus TaxID=120091 RepID=UPI00350E96C7
MSSPGREKQEPDDRGTGRGRGRGILDKSLRQSYLSYLQSISVAGKKLLSNVVDKCPADSIDIVKPVSSSFVVASDVMSSSASSTHQALSSAATSKTDSSKQDERFKKLMKRYGLELTYSDDFHHRFAMRPGHGQQGKPIKLLTNYYPIDFPRGDIFHYDVEINVHNASTREKFNREIMDRLFIVENIFQEFLPAYDGMKNLFTRNPLPIISEQVFALTVKNEEGKEVDCEIKIKPVIKKGDFGKAIRNSISLEPLHQLFDKKYQNMTPEITTAIISMETILRHGPALRLISVGRSFFQKPEGRELSLDNSREIFLGHHQCLKVTESGAMINVDRSSKVFFKGGPVIDFVLDVLYPGERWEDYLRNVRSLTNEQIRVLRKELCGVRIKVTHLPYARKYKISGITEESANNVLFNREINGETVPISVSDYFKLTYKTLRYPNLPCLVSETSPIQKGMEKRTIYLPFEVCEIVQQHYSRNLSDEFKRVVIKRSVQPPTERFKAIQNSLEEIKRDSRPYSEEFGINISSDPLKVVGRILNAPEILYFANQKTQPENGRWNLMNKTFYTGVKIEKWLVLSFSNAYDQSELEYFVENLISEGRNLGLDFSAQLDIRSFDPNTELAGNILRKAKRIYPQLQLAMVVLPSKLRELNIHSQVKTVAETELGIVTQCIKDVSLKKERRLLMPLIRNICQKINAKLGGINNSLLPEAKPAILREDVMLIGADCSHPSPADDIPYSIAAVVGSVDEYPSRYKASVRLQLPIKIDNIHSGRQIIVELKSMLIELFKAFKETNKTAPKKILFYRNGVCDGEFNNVMNYELKAIREACREMNMDNDERKTAVTLIIVGKGHHTRFIPVNPSEGVGKHRNIPPGTTVDSSVVHPIFFDFFTCSHLGIQGTSRPTHYTVLHDDNQFTADELQSLTYQLCYNYSNCTSSISIPCVVKYADSAAYRIKEYLIANKAKIPDRRHDLQEWHISKAIKNAIKIDENVHNSMFFI